VFIPLQQVTPVGMDLLDFTFRIEKSFGIKIGQNDVNVLANGRTKEQLTAGDLHSWIVGMCSDQKVSVPHSSWSRVRLELARVVGKSPNLIHANTLIVRDLGFS
jgi:hypothetical protein